MDENKDMELGSEGENIIPEVSPDAEETAEAQNEAQQSRKNAEEVISKYDKRDAYSDGELEGELERLTDLFRDQLQKAGDEAENSAEPDAEVKDLDEVQREIIPEDMLCRCCGERARDISRGENYEYCDKCREGMRHYPIGIQYFLLAVVMVVAAGVSAFMFFKNFDSFYLIRQAENLENQCKMTSASAKYDEAVTSFEGMSLTAKRIKLKSIELQYSTLSSFSSVSTLSADLDETLSPLEYKLIWNSKYYAMRNKLLTLSATLSAYSEIMSKYEEEAVVPYDTAVSEMEALVGKTTEISAPKSSSNASLLFGGGADKAITVTYDEAFIRFCQYLLLFQKGDTEGLTDYLEKVKELQPEYIWLYGYELGLHYAQNGEFDKAEEMNKVMFENNSEDYYAYFLKAAIKRLNGKYDDAMAICDDGIKVCGDVSELYRQKAICLILKGDYKEAVSVMGSLVDGSITESIYIETIYTYAVAANLAKDDEAKSKAEQMMEYYSIEYSDRVKSFLKGDLTALQLFTEGNCDVT